METLRVRSVPIGTFSTLRAKETVRRVIIQSLEALESEKSSMIGVDYSGAVEKINELVPDCRSQRRHAPLIVLQSKVHAL